ncbi:hypothetical protein STEG23_015680 [Scotinomys teguina]
MFPCAFYISCGAINEFKPCTFVHLLTMENPWWRNYVIKSFVKAENLLFVVDGFDELKFSAEDLMNDICGDWNIEKPVAVLLSSLLQRKMAPHATLLVTTRTKALGQIHLMIDQPFLVEIQGFSEQERQEYFQRFFKDLKFFNRGHGNKECDDDTEVGDDAAAQEGNDAANQEGNDAQEGDDAATQEGDDDEAQEGGDDEAQEGGDDEAQEGGDDEAQEGGDDEAQEGGDDEAQEGGDNDDDTQEGSDDEAQEGGDNDDDTQEDGDDEAQEGGDDEDTQEGGDVEAQEGGDDKDTQEGGDGDAEQGNAEQGDDDNAEQGDAQQGDAKESDDERALRAFNALKGNAALFHMASLPAACVIFCVCLDQGMRKREDLALTCQTHTSMFLNFLFRVFSPETYQSCVKRKIQSLFKKVCILAADTLLEQQPLICGEDLLKLQVTPSDLHPFVCRNILDQKEDSRCYSFFHLSIQQLMAAMMFVQELEQEDKVASKYSVQRLLSREARLKDPNLSGVLLFVFGLLNETRIRKLGTSFDIQISIGVKRKLLEYKSGENKPFPLLIDLQEMLSCLYESQEEGLVKEVMVLFKEISLDLKTVTDLIQASFCLKNSQNLQTVSLQVAKGIFPENDDAVESTAQYQRSFSSFLEYVTSLVIVEMEIKSILRSQDSQHLLALWTDFCDLFNSNEKLVFLDISKSFLSSSSLEILCEKLSYAPCHLQKVLLENCHLTEACCKDISSILMVSQTLTHLNLAKNILGDNGVKVLCESLSYPECKLQTLVNMLMTFQTHLLYKPYPPPRHDMRDPYHPHERHRCSEMSKSSGACSSDADLPGLPALAHY